MGCKAQGLIPGSIISFVRVLFCVMWEPG